MNPKVYCIQHKLTTAEFVSRVQEIAPKYSKATHSMASNPEYGVCLRSEVVRKIGVKRPNREKPCRVTFRLTRGDFESFEAARKANGHTMQQAGEYAAGLYMRT